MYFPLKVWKIWMTIEVLQSENNYFMFVKVLMSVFVYKRCSSVFYLCLVKFIADFLYCFFCCSMKLFCPNVLSFNSTRKLRKLEQNREKNKKRNRERKEEGKKNKMITFQSPHFKGQTLSCTTFYKISTRLRNLSRKNLLHLDNRWSEKFNFKWFSLWRKNSDVLISSFVLKNSTTTGRFNIPT